LVDSLLNIDDDVDANVRVKRAGLLKKLAVGGLVTVEKKGQQAVPMELPVKLAFAANGYPRMGMWLDDALQTRMRVLGVNGDHPPFDGANPDRRVNAHLELLSVMENRNAWLYRSVEGYRALAALNWEFPESKTSGERKSDMERSQDTVVAFLSGFDFDAEKEDIAMMQLYHKYEAWCATTGEHATTWRKFSDRTKEVANRLGLAYKVGDRTTIWRSTST
jgi:phage/plasmid-associated DNA primase